MSCISCCLQPVKNKTITLNGYWKKWMVTLACQAGLPSDEAWFHLTGYVNSQNTHLWPMENPHEVPLHPLKIGVWCGGLLGPLQNSEWYIDIIHEFLGYMHEKEVAKPLIQQDGTRSHISSLLFRDHLILKKLWPHVH